MPKTNNWVNYGDVNPREHGGLFIRYNKDFKEFEILQTTSTRDFEGFKYSYFFEYATVNKSALIKDKELHSFVGLETKENFTEEEIILIASSWISYYGPDDCGSEINNYWGELKAYGIYANILNR